MIAWSQLQNSISQNRASVIDDLCRYLPTDVLLFWSDKKEVASLQNQKWQPLLEMLATKGLSLQTTSSLVVADNNLCQPVFKQLLQQLSDKNLTVCYAAASRLHSVLLGYLLANGDIEADTAFAAAYLEELYQNTRWGTDEQALKQRQTVLQELDELQRIA